MKLDRTSTLYATLLLTGTGLISQILGFFYRIALSRLIGAEVMGLYQLIMPVYFLLLSIVSSGLSTAVSTLSAEYHALHRPDAVRQTLRRCLLVLFAIAVPLGLILSLLSDSISVYLLGDARTRLGLILLAPCLLLTGTENLHKHTFYGSGNVRPAAVTELFEQVVRTCAVLGLLLLFLPQYPERIVGLIVVGMVVSEIFSATTLVILFHRHMGKRAFRMSGPDVPPRRIASIAIPVGLTAVLNNLMGSATSVLIPQRLVAGGMEVSEAMSSFGVLCGMTIPLLNTPTALISAMCLIMVPKLAQSAALRDQASIRRRLDRALTATSVLIMPATALLVVVGPTLGQLLYNEPTAGQFMLPLAAGLLLSCYQAVLGSALNGLSRQSTAARNTMICNGVQLILTWYTVGIPGVGLKGYVAGFLVSTVVGLILNILSIARIAPMTPRIMAWVTSPGLSALLSGLCMNLLFRYLQRHGTQAPFSIGICLILGLALYLILLRVQGIRLRDLFRFKLSGI